MEDETASGDPAGCCAVGFGCASLLVAPFIWVGALLSAAFAAQRLGVVVSELGVLAPSLWCLVVTAGAACLLWSCASPGHLWAPPGPDELQRRRSFRSVGWRLLLAGWGVWALVAAGRWLVRVWA